MLVLASGLLLGGCAAAAVATVGAAGGLGVAMGQDKHRTTATSQPAEPGAMAVEPAGGPTAGGEEPGVMVQPQAPVDPVQVEPID